MSPVARAYRSRTLEVPRTARYAQVGPEVAEAEELWVLIHGYGQLAHEFLATAAALDNGRRALVAPEALSRYYDVSERTAHPQARVGASWMTREHREEEIRDYVRYLDLVVDAVTAGVATAPPIHVLGFSQGATTASRWVALGRTAPMRFIAWGGAIAPELPLTPGAKLRQSALVLVLGDRDKFISAERAAEEEGRLAVAGVPFSTVRFAGGHRLDDATLSALAGA